MAIRSVRRQASNPGATPGQVNSAPIYVDSDDNILKMIPAGSGTTEVQVVDASSSQTLTNKTFTAPIINTPTGTRLTEVVTAANVLTAAESGTTYFLSLAGGFQTTLPAATAGCWFDFVVKTAPTTAYTIITSNGTDQIIFGQTFCADANDSVGDVELTGGATTITFVANVAAVSDRLTIISDGTNWYATAWVNVNSALTFTG